MLYVFLSFFFFKCIFHSFKLLTVSSSLGIVKNVSFTPKDNPSGALYLPVSVWSVSFSRFYIYIHTHTHTHTSVCLCMCVHVRVCLCMCVCVFDPGISLHCHSVNFTFPSSVLFLFPEPLVFFFLDLLDYNIQWWNITSSNSLRENIQQEHALDLCIYDHGFISPTNKFKAWSDIYF